MCFSALYCHSLCGFGCSRFVLVVSVQNASSQNREENGSTTLRNTREKPLLAGYLYQELIKSLVRICFRFMYLHFNMFRAHLLQGSFCLELYFAPFLRAAYSCDHNAYKNSMSSLRTKQISLVTSQHFGHTLKRRARFVRLPSTASSFLFLSS